MVCRDRIILYLMFLRTYLAHILKLVFLDPEKKVMIRSYSPLTKGKRSVLLEVTEIKLFVSG